MARKLHMAFLVAFVIAALMQSSAAQTTHVVGNNSGWIIPPGGATFYPNWVANQVFSVGDILVFNFAATQHDVAKVTKADYDACTTTNPISMETASPARITINATGEHYFICNFNGHCSAGQKLMINVSAATSSPAPQPSSSSSPAPQPSTSTPTPAPQPSTPSPQPSATPAPTPTPVSAPSPSPVSTPTPTPSPVSAPSPSPVSTPTPSPASAPSPGTSAPGVTYTVGDSQGWTLLSNTAAFYQNWASGKNFMPGDILVFNYINGTHDVAELTQENYNSCTTNNPISLNSTPPTRITLTPGEHFYVCAIPGHCSAGQKLAINVTSSGTATPPSSTATPPSSTATPPSSTTPSNPIDPPPSDSSARSLSVAGLSATLLSIVVAFLY